MEIVQSFCPINTAGLLKERKRSAEAGHSGSWGSTDTEDLSSNVTSTLDDPRMTPNVLLSLLLQTHVNPCFVQSSPGDAPRPLQRDSWHLLQHGDLFSLLPGDLVFRVAAEGGDENGDGDGSVTPRCGGGGGGGRGGRGSGSGEGGGGGGGITKGRSSIRRRRRKLSSAV